MWLSALDPSQRHTRDISLCVQEAFLTMTHVILGWLEHFLETNGVKCLGEVLGRIQNYTGRHSPHAALSQRDRILSTSHGLIVFCYYVSLLLFIPLKPRTTTLCFVIMLFASVMLPVNHSLFKKHSSERISVKFRG